MQIIPQLLVLVLFLLNSIIVQASAVDIFCEGKGYDRDPTRDEYQYRGSIDEAKVRFVFQAIGLDNVKIDQRTISGDTTRLNATEFDYFPEMKGWGIKYLVFINRVTGKFYFGSSPVSPNGEGPTGDQMVMAQRRVRFSNVVGTCWKDQPQF